ncbi:MAG TPA: hypothetical protein VMW05_11615 [Methyloceanibacter sp.]|nr:hypothetical protein [Methyloceanibacter sp.]
MHSTIFRSLSAACVSGLLLAGPAFAEPELAEEPVEEEEKEDADAKLVQSLLGQTYTGELPIEGWNDFGGGLVSPPIYVHLYQREDGTSLVLTSKLSAKKYEVTDALLISKPWKGYEISIACMKGDDFTLRFIGDARGPEGTEWWTEVRRAWEIEIVPKPDPEAEAQSETVTEAEPKPDPLTEPKPAPQPGKIKEASAKGVRCASPNW